MNATDSDGSVSTTAIVAIVVAVIALVGVLVGQAITLYNARAQRRDEQTKTVRDDVQDLMMAFFEFAEFARSTSAPGSGFDAADPYEKEWDDKAGPLAAIAAKMAGRGRHRDRVLDLMDGLGLQSRAWQEGESIGSRPQDGYMQMAWAGFEIVAAWLRGERMPRQARRVASLAKKMRATMFAEYRARDQSEDPNHSVGVVRQAWRTARWWLRSKWRRQIVGPVKKLWRYLFAG